MEKSSQTVDVNIAVPATPDATSQVGYSRLFIVYVGLNEDIEYSVFIMVCITLNFRHKIFASSTFKIYRELSFHGQACDNHGIFVVIVIICIQN